MRWDINWFDQVYILFPCRSILLITYGWRPESPWPLLCWVSGTCSSANTDKNDIITAYALVWNTSFEQLLARAHMDSKDRRKIRCLQYMCNLGLSHRFGIHLKKAESSFAMIDLLKLQWIFHSGQSCNKYLFVVFKLFFLLSCILLSICTVSHDNKRKDVIWELWKWERPSVSKVTFLSYGDC